VDRTSSTTATEMNRLEPKFRTSVKAPEASAIWYVGKVAKASAVIGVKAKPNPNR
jgi:hypothetical protein